MSKGIAIHVGLNAVDPDRYAGSIEPLVACEKDARDMADIARASGFASSMLLASSATAKNVTGAIASAAGEIVKGDILLVTYSGHGAQIPDTNGDEADTWDETWCLYDRQLVDDELYGLWAKFAPGVRILVVSDSCHSGTMTRGFRALVERIPESLRREYGVPAAPRFRGMPEEDATRDFARRRAMYAQIQADNPKEMEAAVKATVLLLSGCQDNQQSEDCGDNGRFTAALRHVWGNGKLRGSYRDFHQKIQRQMPPWQSPNVVRTGAQNLAFEKQRPFTV